MAELDLWVKVENGQVVQRPNALPPQVKAWDAGRDALIQSGWLPVVSVKPDSIDFTIELWDSESFEIKSDHVVWTLVKRSKTQDELNAEAVERWRLWRMERNFRLAETDWVIIKYLESGQSVPEAWLVYRQALRDLPLNTNFNGSDWPVKPT